MIDIHPMKFSFSHSGQLVDWLPESMSIVMDCKNIEERFDDGEVFL